MFNKIDNRQVYHQAFITVSKIDSHLLYSSIMFSIAIRYDPAADECSELGLLLPIPAATAWAL